VPNRGHLLPADFWRLWSAATISSIGNGVRLTALPLLAAGLTRDPQSVSLVAAAGGLPWLLFALPAGALVDRWDRKRVLWGADFARTALVGLLALAVASGLSSVPLLATAAFLLGSAETLFANAAQATVAVVVPRAYLEHANGRLYAGELVAGVFVGPPLGGVLFAMAAAVPFAVDAGHLPGRRAPGAQPANRPGRAGHRDPTAAAAVPRADRRGCALAVAAPRAASDVPAADAVEPGGERRVRHPGAVGP